MDRRVWLRSGGYIIIERTEALTAVDVNTGRFVGKRNQEETIFKTNLEATQEVVRQLRLRNVGGIIIIDFIDMEKEGNRKKVYDALKEALKKDKARTNILKISELGLVEMTRQRTRESLENQLLRPCPHCDGRGRIKSAATVAYDVLRAIKRQQAQMSKTAKISSSVCTPTSPIFSTTRKTTAWKISNARSTTASSSKPARNCITRNTKSTRCDPTQKSGKEIHALFGKADAFETPKPERLMQRIITIATNPGDLILDSFAGSGTTGARRTS